jgi:isopentenyl-diphosphate delta-isomerase
MDPSVAARGSNPRLVELTDGSGSVVGTEDVVSAHQDGHLHRAFSVFVFNSNGETLLQRRAPGKRTFGGRWSNTCCGHPAPGEEVLTAAGRRLGEEMGFGVPLEETAPFTYWASDDVSGLTEHEYDHVLVGRFDGSPNPDPTEADEWMWIEVDALRADLARDPSRYTPWLGSALRMVAGT